MRQLFQDSTMTLMTPQSADLGVGFDHYSGAIRHSVLRAGHWGD